MRGRIVIIISISGGIVGPPSRPVNRADDLLHLITDRLDITQGVFHLDFDYFLYKQLRSRIVDNGGSSETNQVSSICRHLIILIRLN